MYWTVADYLKTELENVLRMKYNRIINTYIHSLKIFAEQAV